MKIVKTEMLRVRCEKGWKHELEVFAASKKLDVADVIRLSATEFMQRHTTFSSILTNAKDR